MAGTIATKQNDMRYCIFKESDDLLSLGPEFLPFQLFCARIPNKTLVTLLCLLTTVWHGPLVRLVLLDHELLFSMCFMTMNS